MDNACLDGPRARTIRGVGRTNVVALAATILVILAPGCLQFEADAPGGNGVWPSDETFPPFTFDPGTPVFPPPEAMATYVGFMQEFIDTVERLNRTAPESTLTTHGREQLLAALSAFKGGNLLAAQGAAIGAFEALWTAGFGGPDMTTRTVANASVLQAMRDALLDEAHSFRNAYHARPDNTETSAIAASLIAGLLVGDPALRQILDRNGSWSADAAGDGPSAFNADFAIRKGARVVAMAQAWLAQPSPRVGTPTAACILAIQDHASAIAATQPDPLDETTPFRSLIGYVRSLDPAVRDLVGAGDQFAALGLALHATRASLIIHWWHQGLDPVGKAEWDAAWSHARSVVDSAFDTDQYVQYLGWWKGAKSDFDSGITTRFPRDDAGRYLAWLTIEPQQALRNRALAGEDAGCVEALGRYTRIPTPPSKALPT